MALGIDTLNAYLKIKPITDGFVNQVITQSPFLNLMKKGKAFVTKAGGDYIKVSLNYALSKDATSFQSWDGSTEITLPTDYSFATEGKYKWGYWVAKDLITYKQWMEQEKTEDSIADFAKNRLDNMAMNISREMETQLFTAYDGSSTSFGIPDIAKTTDPANYATGLGDITVANGSWWAAHSETYASASTLVKQMYHMLNHLSVYSSTPTLIVTTQAVFEHFADEAFDKSGYLVHDEIPLKLGFKAGASFNGIPVVWSDQCTAETMYFLNTDYLKLVIHPDANFKSTGWQQVSTTNLNYLALTTLSYNLVCSNRAAQGLLITIND
jgi:hypothetical protein